MKNRSRSKKSSMPDHFDVHDPRHRRIALGAAATTLFWIAIFGELLLWAVGILPLRSPYMLGVTAGVAAFAFGRLFGRWERS